MTFLNTDAIPTWHNRTWKPNFELLDTMTSRVTLAGLLVISTTEIPFSNGSSRCAIVHACVSIPSELWCLNLQKLHLLLAHLEKCWRQQGHTHNKATADLISWPMSRWSHKLWCKQLHYIHTCGRLWEYHYSRWAKTYASTSTVQERKAQSSAVRNNLYFSSNA